MSRTLTDLGLLALVFAAVTVLADLAGATNLGRAMTFGELAFAATLGLILARR